jgi:SNF2 family DNA or RNA helicase
MCETVTVGGPVLRSAKTRAAEAQIAAWLADDPDAKIIVFTQFIGMLKVMSRICSEREWGHALFHGGMSFDNRDNAIQNFSKDQDTKILCASLKAGGVGLNLVAASRVIVIDLWWNESVVSSSLV